MTAFRGGVVDTGFIEEHLDELIEQPEAPPAAVAAAATAVTAAGKQSASTTRGSAGQDSAGSHDPWATIQGWGR